MNTTQLNSRGRINQVEGYVVSDKMDKTISVRVVRLEKHSKYTKYINRKSHFKAHDEENTARIGDKVLISESRPLSKTKRWTLTKVVERAVESIGANV